MLFRWLAKRWMRRDRRRETRVQEVRRQQQRAELLAITRARLERELALIDGDDGAISPVTRTE